MTRRPRPALPVTAPPLAMTCRKPMTAAAMLALVTGLAACSDFDLRGDLTGQFDTTDAVRVVTSDRPRPDANGVISYPGYQVIVVRRGDTIADVAARAGQDPAELARFNGLEPTAPLRPGEVLALPQRLPTAGAGSGVDIAGVAGAAIDRAEQGAGGAAASPVEVQSLSGPEPIQHRVAPGETAYSIARRYGVPLSALAEWNGLRSDYALREDQMLLIPIAEIDTSRPQPAIAPPGGRSRAPQPPSASQPLPQSETAPASDAPPSPNLDRFASESTSGGQFAMPLEGTILRDFAKGRNDGIDIAAAAGSPVRAAAAGTVAAITRDTDGVPILVLRHADGFLTVYAGLDDLTVKKDDTVRRGQAVAKLRAGNPAFLHFELRKGLEAVDPTPYLSR